MKTYEEAKTELLLKLKPRGLARMRKVWNENPDAFEKELERIPSTVSMSESSRKRYFKIFPNAERRYLDYIKKESNKWNLWRSKKRIWWRNTRSTGSYKKY